VLPLAKVRAEEIDTYKISKGEKTAEIKPISKNQKNYSQQTKEGLNNNFSKMQSASKECVQSISDSSDIYIEQIDKGSQNELYVENICHYEINIEIDNNLCI